MHPQYSGGARGGFSQGHEGQGQAAALVQLKADRGKVATCDFKSDPLTAGRRAPGEPYGSEQVVAKCGVRFLMLADPLE